MIAKDTLVQFTIGPLGLIDPDGTALGFVEQTVAGDDVGHYDEAHPMLEDWHMVRVVLLIDDERKTFLAPVHRGHFTVVE